MNRPARVSVPPCISAADREANRLRASWLQRLLTRGAGTDGRLILAAALTAYFAGVAAAALIWRVDAWPALGVPPGPTLFFDTRNVTAAWECQRLGYDPLYENPCDPWGRPLMYLRPWLLLGVLGLDQSHTALVATSLIAAMFLSFGLLVGRVPLGTGLMLAAAACSPAVMLAVERGNMDVGLFSLVAGALLLWRSWPEGARILSPVLLLIGATAKLYPVFALAALVVARDPAARRAALICIAAFGAYSLYCIRDIVHVAEIATQGQVFSYGARILPAHLYHQLGADRWAGPAVLKQALAVVPLGLLAAAIIVRARRRLETLEDAVVATAPMLALQMGGLIYLGTFLTANNFDYRLVFLLLTLPQLAQWVSLPAHNLSSLASVLLVAIVVLLWVGSLSSWLGLWDELASWAVASLLIALLSATLPPHVLRLAVSGRRGAAGPNA